VADCRAVGTIGEAGARRDHARFESGVPSLIARSRVTLGALLRAALGFVGGAATVVAAAESGTTVDAVTRCLSCHLAAEGGIDIVGLRALDGLPEEWPFLYEDAFDLDMDGVAGTMRFVSGVDSPLPGLYGEALAAGRFEDFAEIAAGVHGISIEGPAEMARLRATFESLSPDPEPPDATDLAAFEARGCAACHVTRAFEHDGRTYRPLSDFLLHDLGDGPRRTAPLWGCPECLSASGHDDTNRSP